MHTICAQTREERTVNSQDEKEFLEGMRKFLELATRALDLETLPSIVWDASEDHVENRATFGTFMNDDQSIIVKIRNRHPLDIMRTLAHELAHYKQWLDGEINDQSGETGSKQENQAHAKAGIIMRYFDRMYPKMFSSKPVA